MYGYYATPASCLINYLSIYIKKCRIERQARNTSSLTVKKIKNTSLLKHIAAQELKLKHIGIQ